MFLQCSAEAGFESPGYGMPLPYCQQGMGQGGDTGTSLHPAGFSAHELRLPGIVVFSIIPRHFLSQRLWLCELNCDWRGPEVAEQDSKSHRPPSPFLMPYGVT